MSKFNWGLVIARIELDIDGVPLSVVKYHPWKTEGSQVIRGKVDESTVRYSCEELNLSTDSMDSMLISWIANRRLGLNQYALTAGVCRALNIQPDPVKSQAGAGEKACAGGAKGGCACPV